MPVQFAVPCLVCKGLGYYYENGDRRHLQTLCSHCNATGVLLEK